MRRVLAIAALILLTGCGQQIDNSKLRVDIVESPPQTIAISALPLPPASAYLRAASAQGLVSFDIEGRVTQGLASRWIVTDDNRSYIFRLEKTRWNNGREVNSNEVAAILIARLRELRTSRFAADIAVIDRVVPMTGKIVEIRLAAPMPHLLDMLAQPEFGLVQRGVGSGPMRARKVAGGMQLQRKGVNEKGEPVIEPETVNIRGVRAALALARYVEGENDMITDGRFEDLPLLSAADIDANELHFDPVPGMFGLMVADDGPFLSNSGNREAIAMAIDRPKMLTAFDIVWREVLTLSPETIRNRVAIERPTWTLDNISARKATARDIIAKWESGNGEVRPLRVALPNGPGARILFAMLQVDLADIGLQAVRVAANQDADLRLIDRPADMPGQAWYLGQLSCTATPICSEHADQLLTDARNAPDIATRSQLLSEAETELQRLRNFIPIAYPLRWSVVRPGLLGFALNRRGTHPLQYLGRDPT